MARKAWGTLDVNLRVIEELDAKGISEGPHDGRTQHVHLLDIFTELYDQASGSYGVSQPWSKTVSLSANTPVTHNLTEGLISQTSGSLTPSKVLAIAARHKGTAGQADLHLTSNGLPISGSTGPGGTILWFSPIDGASVVSGSADTVVVDSEDDAFDVDLMILGRSS